MEDVKETEIQNFEETQEQQQEEINYKEKYEELIAQRQREEDLSNFKISLAQKGLVIDGNIEEVCKEYNKNDFDKFINLIGRVKEKETITYKYNPARGEDPSIPTTSFQSEINKMNNR